MVKPDLHLDFETRSECDITEAGAWVYSQHPSTSVLCFSFYYGPGTTDSLIANTFTELFNKGAPICIIPKEGDILTASDVFPDWCFSRELFFSKFNKFVAHNASFEFAIWNNICVPQFGFFPLEEADLKDTMAKVAAHSMPLSLEGAGGAFGLDVTKSEDGKRIMQQLAKPRNPSKENPDLWFTREKYPEKFDALYEYCKTDVLCEYHLDHAVKDLSETEQRVWLLDRIMNHRGVAVDIATVRKAVGLITEYDTWGKEELFRLTGGAVSSISQVAKLAEWIRQNGIPNLPNATKLTMTQILSPQNEKRFAKLPVATQQVIKLRLALGKSSVKKLRSMLACSDIDGVVRNILAYHAASTGRWGGRLIQVQNLPKGSFKSFEEVEQCISTIHAVKNIKQFLEKYPDPLDAISSVIRALIVSKPGTEFIASDYASIETRVLMWLAMQSGDLDVKRPHDDVVPREYGASKAVQFFRDNGDLYCDMASYVYKRPITKEKDKNERQLGKAIILGAGYGMGAPKFKLTCEQQGLAVDEQLAKTAIRAYREKYWEVPLLWKGLEAAARTCVSTGKNTSYGPIKFYVVKNSVDNLPDFLYVVLPSGRELAYYKPRIVYGPNKFDPTRESAELTFLAVSANPKKMVRLGTYGGMLTENVVQAIARDCMVEGLFKLEQAGYPVVMTIHDEVVSEVPIGFGSLEEFEGLLSIPPTWAPDLPILAAEGWRGLRYRK